MRKSFAAALRRAAFIAIIFGASGCDDLVEGMRASTRAYTQDCAGMALPPGLAEVSSPSWCALGLSGEGVTVAVIDAGFAGLRDNPFTQNVTVAATADFVDGDDADFFRSHSNHGTQIVESLGGKTAEKLHGFAWNATYVLARTEDIDRETPQEEERLAEGIAWAIAQGARVVAVGLGYHDFDGDADDYDPEILDGESARATRALNALAAEHPDVLIVVSAGNEGDKEWKYVLPPADSQAVLSVGAIGADGERASYSGVGPTSLPYIKPDLAAQLLGRGASLAAPVIAGLAAQMFEYDPTLSAAEAADRLRRSGSNADSPDRQIGYGYPQTQALLEELRSDR